MSRTIKHGLFVSGDSVLHVHGAFGSAAIPVVDRYEHLGGIVTTTGSVKPEAAHRCVKAGHSFFPLARRGFCVPQLRAAASA
eukprot:10171042-Alexandrium_andersonii.AAC.1